MVQFRRREIVLRQRYGLLPLCLFLLFVVLAATGAEKSGLGRRAASSGSAAP